MRFAALALCAHLYYLVSTTKKPIAAETTPKTGRGEDSSDEILCVVKNAVAQGKRAKDILKNNPLIPDKQTLRRAARDIKNGSDFSRKEYDRASSKRAKVVVAKVRESITQRRKSSTHSAEAGWHAARRADQ